MMQREHITFLRRASVAAIFCLLSFLMVGAQQSSRNNRASSTSGQPGIVDIRQIDFRNFTYMVNGKSYKLRDGFYAENVSVSTRWELGMVDGPFYGDLTGDGKAEVAFVLSYGTGRANAAAEVRIYTLQQGRPVLLATLAVKAGVDCELDHYLRVADGMISIERVYGRQGACDYNEVTEYRWNGHEFAPVGASMRMPCRCM
jgi:hypothetical protein